MFDAACNSDKIFSSFNFKNFNVDSFIYFNHLFEPIESSLLMEGVSDAWV